MNEEREEAVLSYLRNTKAFSGCTLRFDMLSERLNCELTHALMIDLPGTWGISDSVAVLNAFRNEMMDSTGWDVELRAHTSGNMRYISARIPLNIWEKLIPRGIRVGNKTNIL